KLKPGCDKCCRKCCTAAKIGPCQKPLEERLEASRWLQSGPQTPSQPTRLDCACWFSSQSARNSRSAPGAPVHRARLCLLCVWGYAASDGYILLVEYRAAHVALSRST